MWLEKQVPHIVILDHWMLRLLSATVDTRASCKRTRASCARKKSLLVMLTWKCLFQMKRFSVYCIYSVMVLLARLMTLRNAVVNRHRSSRHHPGRSGNGAGAREKRHFLLNENNMPARECPFWRASEKI